MEKQTLLILIISIWAVIMSLEFYYSVKYAVYRKEAYAAMEKTRLAAYSVPLLLSIVFITVFRQELMDYIYGALCIWIIGMGLMSGVVLFDAFESKKMKYLRSESVYRNVKIGSD